MKNVYFNHDGNIDDLTSLLLLLQVPDIRLIGVGVTDADCYVEPAAEASRKMIDRFNTFNHQVEVALSNSRPKHPFPKEWRLSSQLFSISSFASFDLHYYLDQVCVGCMSHKKLFVITYLLEDE